MAEVLSGKRMEILKFIGDCLQDRGYPPSVREIGEAVGLNSSATVHSHLAVLQKEGFLQRDPTKPRAMTVQYDPSSKVALPTGRVRSVPLVGTVAAGTGVLAHENVEELYSLPEEFAGTGETFMLKVRGDSMVNAGILDGDYVVVRHQPDADDGDIVVAGIPDEEATVKRLRRQGNTVILIPANDAMAPIELPGDQVSIYGKVISVLRRL
ncbi:MAG: transcriptional repressor LexA [Actinomycetes bacterium]|jgi:repressor LexA